MNSRTASVENDKEVRFQWTVGNNSVYFAIIHVLVVKVNNAASNFISQHSLSLVMDSALPSEQVVERIAQKEGVSAVELSPPLYSVVDPEALDALVLPGTDSDSDGVEIEFSYLGYSVRVECDPGLRISVSNGDTSNDNSEAISG